MNHLVLLGDSIFDNARYVPGRPPVIEQVGRALPGWRATLVAVDGHTVDDISFQVQRIPPDATHLVLSIGGNDALGASYLLREPAVTVGDGLEKLAEGLRDFQRDYVGMIERLIAVGKPLLVCTIYDLIPVLSVADRVGLNGFNDVILRVAIAAGLPVIDLRHVCTHVDDYSPMSPIEPSVVGGAKIAEAIARAVTGHDFEQPRTAIYI